MTTSTNHTVTLLTRFGTTIIAPATYVKDLGNSRALVYLETNLHIEDDRDLRVTYATGSREVMDKYRVRAKVFTRTQTYIYMGVFTHELIF